MGINFNSKFISLGEIAEVMIEAYPHCEIQYVGADEPKNRILCVKGTGLYLMDFFPYLDDSIRLRYGATQDTIHFYYV